jgi:peroxiredoxin
MGVKTFALLSLFLLAGAASAESLAGLWDATITVDNSSIPFQFELTGDGDRVTGAFFNGDDKFTSTGGRFDGALLTLSWDYYASKLEATLKDGVLEGTYTRASRQRGGPIPFTARRSAVADGSAKQGPAIAGLWEIPAKSSKGEAAWRFIVQQRGARTTAAILRVDGDTGAFTGTYQNGKFVLSHFDGARSGRMEVTPLDDGTLEIVNVGEKIIARRPAEARAKGLPEPTDPTRHTSVKDPKEPFTFSCPDLRGSLISNADPRFEGKVVLINITGSWCPNCHDEAPFLAALYKQFRARGLEIVGLSFEEPDQLKNPTRLRAFVKKYGIDYPMLLCGEPAEANTKLSQAVNWNSWPTTFFVDRQGVVQSVHAGFPSSASGELYVQAKEEFSTKVEQLLGK